MRKKAVLLINLGTPDNCDPASVKRYLKEFLNDPRVIDLPKLIRWPLVNVGIIPFRYKKTAAAYAQIWQAGSPLLTITQQLKDNLAASLGEDYQVEYAMRYGNPSIPSVFNKIKYAESITVIPLFPQYSSAATGSALEKLLSCYQKEWNTPTLNIIHDFYNHPGFINATAEIVASHINNKKIDKLIFSYHGLPERHLSKSHPNITCDHQTDEPIITQQNRFCYRTQCYVTTKLIAERLHLPKQAYTVAFQSRLGRTPWIKPYTDLVLPELAKSGHKNIAIVSPSFVADCLETLEEINIRTRKQWRDLGGEEFTYIPCVNDSATWVNALKNLVNMI